MLSEINSINYNIQRKRVLFNTKFWIDRKAIGKDESIKKYC